MVKEKTVEKKEKKSGEEKVKAVKEKTVTVKPEAVKLAPEQLLKNYEILLFPLVSEKSVGAIELHNKISFVVKKDSSKNDVKKAVEELYNVRVSKVNVIRDLKGRKKAIVKLDSKFKASDLATKLGVI